MTRDERIAAATETLERRVSMLRRGVRVKMPDWWIAKQFSLIDEGIVAVQEALDSTGDPPAVRIGQGTSETEWPPKENSDG